MSDPSILLLLTCVTCADSGDRFAQLSTPDCVESSSQAQRFGQPKSMVNCTQAVSTPETIPAFLTTASQPLATVQTTATERAIAPRPSPPEPFILPETFTKPPTDNSPQPNRSSNPAITASVESSSLLKLGSRGEAVNRLQEKLQQLEYYTGSIDGIYGQLTFAALTRFQQAEGLTVDGIAGPATWARLEALSATSATPLTPTNREATATLNPDNQTQRSTTTATTAQTSGQPPNQTTQPSGTERLETASTAGEIAGNAPSEESQALQQDSGSEQPSSAQASPAQASQEAPNFVFDTSPSGGPFYFWIGAWAIVYIGGMLFIFKDGINKKLGLNWGKSDESEQQDIQLPAFGPSTLDQFVSGLDYDPSSDSSDDFGPAASNPSGQDKQNLVSQHDRPRYFSREENDFSRTQDSQADAESLNDSGKTPIFSLLEKLAYESPRLSNQELTPTWADGGVVEPIRGLFSDLPHPLGTPPSERRRNKAIAPPSAASAQSVKQNPDSAEAPSTLIATLPAEDPETKTSYTYALLDNAEGYFLLKGNELRIYDTALVKIESDVDHAITLRRTDAEGTQVDKSFMVSFTKTGDEAEMARSA